MFLREHEIYWPDRPQFLDAGTGALAQRIDNLYSLVTRPRFYKALMAFMGADAAHERYANEVLQARAGMKVLDVGCGPAAILHYLPQVDYTGIDLNEKHIAFARSHYGERGRFIVGNAAADLKQEEGMFDLINVSGLLHHLSDDECRTLFASLKKLLKPDGRIVTLDNVWLPRQRLAVKVLNSMDSGLNIRTPEQYLDLPKGFLFDIESCILHDMLRIPYDHFIMIARNQ